MSEPDLHLQIDMGQMTMPYEDLDERRKAAGLDVVRVTCIRCNRLRSSKPCEVITSSFCAFQLRRHLLGVRGAALWQCSRDHEAVSGSRSYIQAGDAVALSSWPSLASDASGSWR